MALSLSQLTALQSDIQTQSGIRATRSPLRQPAQDLQQTAQPRPQSPAIELAPQIRDIAEALLAPIPQASLPYNRTVSREADLATSRFEWETVRVALRTALNTVEQNKANPDQNAEYPADIVNMVGSLMSRLDQSAASQRRTIPLHEAASEDQPTHTTSDLAENRQLAGPQATLLLGGPQQDQKNQSDQDSRPESDNRPGLLGAALDRIGRHIDNIDRDLTQTTRETTEQNKRLSAYLTAQFDTFAQVRQPRTGQEAQSLSTDIQSRLRQTPQPIANGLPGLVSTQFDEWVPPQRLTPY